MMRRVPVLLIALLAAAAHAAAQGTAEWTEPFPPFKIAGNLYYVGTKGLASYLVATPEGHILINSNLEATVPMVRDSIEKLGFKFTDVKILLISHAHWDHVGGADLFPRATVWIQRDEYTYYLGEAWHARNTHGGIDPRDMAALLEINTEGRLRFVNGDDQEILPGIRCYTGGRHTHASQYVSAQTAGGTAVLTSDNMYLYENMEKHAPIAQTLDAKSNLAAQDRIRRLASDPSLIVPGHDPAVFERYPHVSDDVVRIK